jgi:catechol 2,3-dioxygenase-like lactoylglutathione lyase family enzyme
MTAPNVDIVIDCNDLRRLADFWAAALGYREAAETNEYVLLLPREMAHPPVLLQRVPEPKTAKTRVHFDLRVDDVDGRVAELEALGAHRIDVGQPQDAEFVPMADPEGNEFCVCSGAPLTL